MQIDFVTELFKAAKLRDIHTCLDTSGVTFSESNREKFDALFMHTDLVLLDIKHIDSQVHKRLTGHGNENILKFAEYLRDKNIPVWIRHVVVPNITDKSEDLFRLGEYLSSFRNMKALDVLPYHDMGKVKYEALGMEYPLGNTPVLSKEDGIKARDIIIKGIKSGLRKRKESKNL